MMYRILVFAVMMTAALAQNRTCDKGYWGMDCMNVCGECLPENSEDPVCDFDNGNCLSGCVGGYTGQRCDEAVCDNGCGPGVCLAPNFCGNCNSINHVSPTCEDIRIRGLLGSLIAFIAIIASISLCGLGSVWYKRRQSIPVHL